MVQCDAVPLATRYRWRMLIVGVQPDYRLAASSKEPMASITDVLPGQTVKILVQAVNENLQGVASDPVLFTLPVATPPPAPKRAPEAPADTNAGKENGDGHRRLAPVG